MQENDHPSAEDVAVASAELALVANAAAGRPIVYPSAQRGPEPISEMNKTHAARAARAVREGRRPGGEPMAKALDRQAKTPRRLTK